MLERPSKKDSSQSLFQGIPDWDCFPGLRFDEDKAQADAPEKPIWITETGYETSGTSSATGYGEYVPAQYEPAYFVREVLWALNNDVPRVYFYALVDDPSAAYWLVDKWLQPKPAFAALSNLIHLTADPGSTTTPGALDLTLTGGDRFLMHSLFEKSDGTFYLALWLAESDWDGSKGLTPASESVSIATPGHTILSTDSVLSSGTFLPSSMQKSSTSLEIRTSPIFLVIRSFGGRTDAR